MNWITKLERKYGRFCIPNLINILIGGQILVYAIELFVNQYISFYLSLSRSALFAGQIWRLFTFVLVPFSGGGPLSVVLGIYFTWAAAKENDCAPLTIAGAPLIVRFAPQVKVINPPNAINKPAIKAETKYPTLFFSKKSAFALPALHNVANSFLNIYVPSLFL